MGHPESSCTTVQLGMYDRVRLITTQTLLIPLEWTVMDFNPTILVNADTEQPQIDLTPFLSDPAGGTRIHRT
jgi:hypothetical protein